MPAPGHILIVCTGNICRSPMGEALLKHALSGQTEPLRSLKVISAGVASRTGEPISENSVTALKKVGIDISAHRGPPPARARRAAPGGLWAVPAAPRPTPRRGPPPPPPPLSLFREFPPPPAEKEIGAPYGGPLKLYETCRDEMVEAIPSL